MADASTTTASAEPALPSAAVRGYEGINVSNAAGVPRGAPLDTASTCRSMAYSKDGTLFAWCNSQTTTVIRTADGSVVREIPRPKVTEMVFSPRNTFLATWETFGGRFEALAGAYRVQMQEGLTALLSSLQ
eukprot:m.301888 g.301888  ORF g.301888 m.301888 type:complete len:131 (-) comp55227_c0_seq8:1707-2099(-)